MKKKITLNNCVMSQKRERENKKDVHVVCCNSE